MIRRCMFSSTPTTSWTPMRPLNPVPSHAEHPLPAYQKRSVGFTESRRAFTSETGPCWRQLAQSRLTSRCATIPISPDAIKNGGTPMSRRRVTDVGASFEWSVDKTRCPVIAARNAISAVSESRISPTRTISGSCRRIARSCRAKVRPTRSFTLLWLTPGRSISTGSSQVTRLTVGERKALRAA